MTDVEPTTLDEFSWTSEIEKRKSCANCGSQNISDYCADCGQKIHTTRLRTGALLKDLTSRLFNLEKGLLHTLVDLLRRPGMVIRDYVSGKQKPYVNPLTFFFIGAAAQLLTIWILAPSLEGRIKQQVRDARATKAGSEMYEKLDERFGQDTGEFMASTYTNMLQQVYSYAALLFFCIPFAIALKVLHGAAGDRFSLGETIIFSLYSFGMILLLTAIISTLTMRISIGLQSTLSIVTYFGFIQHAHTRFFRNGGGSRLLTLISTLIASACFFSSIVAILIGSLVVSALWNVNFA